MAAIQFPLSSSPGAYPQESGGRLINAHVEKLGDGARSPVRWIRPPGLLKLAQATASYINYRGGISVGGLLLVVFNERVQSLSLSGSTWTVTDLGALAGTQPVTIARNNLTPTPQIVAVTENGAFNLFVGSAPTAFADVDVGIPNSVSFGGGYFVFTYGDGSIRVTGLNAVTIDALSVAKAEQRSDGLLAGRFYNGLFYALGQESIEVYRVVGTTPFPLAYLTMIPRGLIGQWAVAGTEAGWSNELCWVGDDGVGYRLSGNTPIRVSDRAVERDIANTPDKANIRASVFMAEGHAYWVLTAPWQWTWVLDLSTEKWHERKSYLREDFKGRGGVKAFDRWIMGDDTTGNLYEVRAGHAYEGTDPLIFHAESVPAQEFPSRIAVPRMDLNFTPGVGLRTGTTNETDPQAEVSWSDNGGQSWGVPLLRKLGRTAEGGRRVTVLRTGMTGVMGRQVRVRVSDPVHVGLMGGQMAVSGRRE